ncbi:MAG: cbb3-type cytochrome c oxidase N-terminal domain-containing protein [Niabella sp.]
MKNIQTYFLKIFTAFVLLLSTLGSFGQGAATDTTPAVDPQSIFVVDINVVLAIVAILLFLILGVLAITLKSSMEVYRQKVDEEKQNKSGAAKVATMMAGLLFFFSFNAIAQTDAAAPQEAVFSDNHLLRYLLIFIIFIELVAIFAVIKWMRFFTGIEDLQVAKGKKGILGMSFNKWWDRINKVKPIKEEADIDMGHSYDGIRELDNVLPPWFTWTFIGTIIFGIVYLWRFYGSSDPAPDQYQEYEHSVAQAKIKLDAYLASKGDAVDETNVTMLGANGIESGKKIFEANCVACHGAQGQGGVGPNLTDNYWLHGGSIGDVFKVIKVGVVEKGMQSWKDVFSATQIAELSSYIKSIHGTNPPGAKEPQGEEFTETATGTPAATDSTAAPVADSATAK